MLTSIEAVDRLVRVLEKGPLPAEDAARALLALSRGPTTVARAVLDEVVRVDARLDWRDGAVSLAPAPWATVGLERARLAVVDLETTGLTAGVSQISEAAAVILVGETPTAELELRGRPGAEAAAELLAFAGDSVLCGHNLGFDLRFLDLELRLARGARVAAPVVDTLVLARRLLSGRTEGLSLAALAELLGTSTRPAHHALADARATAEILVRLIHLARERGARTVGDLCALARRRSGPPRSVA